MEKTCKPELVRLPDGRLMSKADFDACLERFNYVLLGSPINDGDNHLVHFAAHGFEVPPAKRE